MTDLRSFINIVENAQEGVPDAKSFVTPQLIDRIIKTGYWVSHGSELGRWIDDIQDEGQLPAELTNMDYHEMTTTPVFRQMVERWLTQRAEYVNEQLRKLHAETWLARMIHVDQAWVDGLTTVANLTCGVYWSAGGEIDAYGSSVHDRVAKPVEIVFHARLENVTVDWRETIEARFDYMYADEEMEIQLVPGTWIGVEAIDVNGDPVRFKTEFEA